MAASLLLGGSPPCKKQTKWPAALRKDGPLVTTKCVPPCTFPFVPFREVIPAGIIIWSGGPVGFFRTRPNDTPCKWAAATSFMPLVL